MFYVKAKHIWGVANIAGKFVFPLIYDSIAFNHGLFIAALHKKWGFTSKNGKPLIAFKYDSAKFFYDGLAAVAQHGKWGFINKNDLLVVPFKYDNVDPFSDAGQAMVKLNQKWGAINKAGKITIPIKFTYEQMKIKLHYDEDDD